MNRWIISDLHFNHNNIIKYCNRPFENVDEMNTKIISNWNSIVGKDDIVYNLGDFGFGSKEEIKKLRAQLHGQQFLILGNHDNHPMQWYYDCGFNKVYDKPILIEDFILLSHAPINKLTSNMPFINIYGHVHTNNGMQSMYETGICVCVELTNYYPINLDEMIKKIKEIRGDID